MRRTHRHKLYIRRNICVYIYINYIYIYVEIYVYIYILNKICYIYIYIYVCIITYGSEVWNRGMERILLMERGYGTVVVPELVPDLTF